jgi:excisionase family DNA binding protein
MITPDEAAAVRNISSRTIYRWIEDGRLHFIEGLTGVLICAESLPLNNDVEGTELSTIS